jgi:hypothetical protein
MTGALYRLAGKSAPAFLLVIFAAVADATKPKPALLR